MADEKNVSIKFTANASDVDKAIKDIDKQIDKLYRELANKKSPFNTIGRDITNISRNFSKLNSKTSPLQHLSSQMSQISVNLKEISRQLGAIANNGVKINGAMLSFSKKVNDAATGSKKLNTNIANSGKTAEEAVQKITPIPRTLKTVATEVQKVGQEVKNVDSTKLDELGTKTEQLADTTKQAAADTKDNVSGLQGIIIGVTKEATEAVTETSSAVESISGVTVGKVVEDVKDMGSEIQTVVKSIEADFGSAFASFDPTSLKAFDGAEKSIESVKKKVQKEIDALNAKMVDLATKPVKSDALAAYEDQLKEMQKKLADFQKTQSRVQQKIGGKTNAEEWVRLDNAIADAELKISEFVQKQSKVSGAEYEEIGKKIAEANAELQKMNERKAELEKTGSAQDFSWWANLQNMIEETTADIEVVVGKMKELHETGKDWTMGDNTQAYREYETKMEGLQKQMENLNAASAEFATEVVEDTTAAGDAVEKDFTEPVKRAEKAVQETTKSVQNLGSETTSVMSVVRTVIDTATGTISNMFTDVIGAFKSVKNIIGSIGSTISSIWSGIKSIGSGLKTFFTPIVTPYIKIGSAVKSIISKYREWRKEHNLLKNASDSLYKAFTKFTRMLVTRIKRTFVSQVFGEIKEQFRDLAKVSDDFNDAMSSMIASAKQLGAQIVAIIEPIVTTFGPIISQILDVAAEVADKVAQFVSKLFGKDTYVAASKQQYNYRESLEDTTDSTKDATKAAKEYQRTILSFDEINALSAQNTTETKTADEITGLSDTALNKAQVQASKLNDIADSIFDAFNRGDWKGVGSSIASLFNEGVGWLKDTFGWSNNSEGITNFISGLVEGINGFLEGIDSKKLGDAIGDIANTIIEIVRQLTDPENGINFEELGTTLGEAFVTAADTINWEHLGEAIIQVIQAFARGINAMISVPGFGKKLGKAIKGILVGIDTQFDPDLWSDLIANVLNGLSEAMDEITSSTRVDEAMQETNLLKRGFKVNQAMLQDNIDKAMGKEPKTVFDSIGEHIGDTLIKVAEKTKFGGVGSIVGKLATAILKFLNGIFGEDGVGTAVGQAFSDFMNGVGDSLPDEELTKFIDNIKKFIEDFFAVQDWSWTGEIGDFVINLISGGISIAGTISTELLKALDESDEDVKAKLTEWGTTFVDAIKEGFGDINIVSMLWNGIWNGAKGIAYTVGGEEFTENAKEGEDLADGNIFTGLLSTVESIGALIAAVISTGIVEIINIVSTFFTGHNAFNDVMGIDISGTDSFWERVDIVWKGMLEGTVGDLRDSLEETQGDTSAALEEFTNYLDEVSGGVSSNGTGYYNIVDLSSINETLASQGTSADGYYSQTKTSLGNMESSTSQIYTNTVNFESKQEDTTKAVKDVENKIGSLATAINGQPINVYVTIDDETIAEAANRGNIKSNKRYDAHVAFA